MLLVDICGLTSKGLYSELSKRLPAAVQLSFASNWALEWIVQFHPNLPSYPEVFL